MVYDVSKNHKCGCYIKNLISADAPFNDIAPLRHINYHLEIVNCLLNITLKQTYFNPTDKFL
jgi:hypothetical protein